MTENAELCQGFISTTHKFIEDIYAEELKWLWESVVQPFHGSARSSDQANACLPELQRDKSQSILITLTVSRLAKYIC